MRTRLRFVMRDVPEVASLRLSVNDKRPRGTRTLGLNCLLALAMFGFGVAHVVGATIVSRSAAFDRTPSALAAVHTD